VAALLEERAPEKPFARLSDRQSQCGDWSRNAEADAGIGHEERLLTERIERLVLNELARWNAESVFLDLEWAGRICRTRTGDIRVHGVRSGGADSVVPDKCMIGETEVGHFHTHGRWGSAGFSAPDMDNAISTPSVRVYVATPCRAVFRVWKAVATVLDQKAPQKPFSRYLGPTLTCVT